jgi:hypothetical protein
LPREPFLTEDGAIEGVFRRGASESLPTTACLFFEARARPPERLAAGDNCTVVFMSLSSPLSQSDALPSDDKSARPSLQRFRRNSWLDKRNGLAFMRCSMASPSPATTSSLFSSAFRRSNAAESTSSTGISTAMTSCLSLFISVYALQSSLAIFQSSSAFSCL